MTWPARRQRVERNSLGSIPPLVLFLWAALWLNLNTSVYDVRQPESSEQWTLLVRALLPSAVLPIALVCLLNAGNRLKFSSLNPSSLLVAYGVVAAISSVFSPEPWWAFYWAVAFLATLFTARIVGCARCPETASRQMLQITWAATFLVAAIITYTSRDLIFGDAASTYGRILGDLGGQFRSSGVARWAAVPGLVCLIKAYHARRPVLIAAFLGAAGVSFFIVYRMQSRGAVFGAVAALLFALFTANRLRRYALPFLVFAGIALVVAERSDTISSGVSSYIRRGQTEEQFRSMTGRTRAYEKAWNAFPEAPVFGRGNWSDRLIIGEHVHNSFLQALLNAGIVGFVPYLGSWVAGWILFFRLLRTRRTLPPKDRIALLEAGAVMAFFTVRAIPETTTASFSVDLLVMAAVYVYLESVARVKSGGARRPPVPPGQLWDKSHEWRTVTESPAPCGPGGQPR